MGTVAVQNTTASLSGKTLAKLEDTQTITGQKTFDLGASAPFVCVSGAAVVANLDADKLDGFEATAFPRLAAANAFTTTNTFADNIALAATKKLYLDGVGMTGDTYILESSANVLSLFSGGVESKLTSGVLTLSAIGTHTITGGSNAAQTLSVVNTTSGTAGKVEHLQTAGTAVGRLTTFSQGFTTSGVEMLSATLLQGQGAGGLNISASNAAGIIRFYAGGATLRGSFDESGDLYVGAITALPSGATIGKAFEAANAYAMRSSVTTTSAQSHVEFYNGNGIVGSITTDASATAYNTSSDARLKDDLGVAADLSALIALRVHDFAWKADGLMDRGVFAQEAYPLFPRAVTVGSEDLSKPWSVDYSKFVAHLIAGWQQHEARIAELERRG